MSVDAIERFLEGQVRGLLLLAAAGMGKGTTLAALRRELQVRHVTSLWISGSTVASEGHFLDLLSQGLGEELPRFAKWEATGNAVLELIQGRTPQELVILVDDIDALAYKRESLMAWLATCLDGNQHLRLAGTARPNSAERLAAPGRPMSRYLVIESLPQLDEQEAGHLVRRRVPGMSPGVVDRIVTEAGAHPAALVFLSRLVQIRQSEVRPEDMSAILERAAEIAGAVYAEPWAALGPQQRAILWHLSNEPHGTGTAAQIAEALALPPSQVSAQLTRLSDESLVRQLERGQPFSIAPLFARWILRRAARGTAEPSEDSWAQSTEAKTGSAWDVAELIHGEEGERDG